MIHATRTRSSLPYLKCLATCLVSCVAACGDASSETTGSESASALAANTGTGLSAQYFDDETLGALHATRTDAQVNFTWGLGAPMTGMAVDGFSVRWSGQVEAPVSGTYTFTTTSDDGVRLWVDGQELVNDWTTHAATSRSGQIALVAGKRYAIKMEYFEGTGRAEAILAWTYPGQAQQVIPQKRLYPPSRGITVSGDRLLRDGAPWVPKGLSMIGSLTKGSAVQAYAHWGDAELAAGRSWGADAMRLQVSQPYLDPQSSQYSAAYLTRIESMVALAEAHGFALILSMQDQSLAGGNADPLPTTSTERAWNALAPVFAADPEVIYELYNEPQNNPDAAGWSDWLNGKTGTIGHQRLLDDVRAAGAQNVVLADGANHAEILTGVPMLNDPLGRVGYAAHPYYIDSINTNPNAWDQRFGNLSATVPVVVTEWDATSINCSKDAPTRAPQLIAYLGQHNIGVFGWAFDLPNTLVKDFNWTPTTYVGFTCGVDGGGAGALLKATFSQ